MTGGLIDAKDIVFGHRNGAVVLDDVSLELQRGEILGILGPNGSGKTTFMKCLNRILTLRGRWFPPVRRWRPSLRRPYSRSTG